MTSGAPFLDEQSIDQAAAWLLRLHAESVTEADWLELEVWLAEKPANRTAYDRAERMWQFLEEEKQSLSQHLNEATPVAYARSNSRRRPRTRAVWTWGSAGVALAAAASIVVVIAQPPPTTTYQTRPGERRTVNLPDGSTIAMNGGSSLSVTYSRKRRFVTMGSAEAAFDVTHTPGRPFVIDVGRSEVQVVGTAFDIRRDTDSTRVVVSRGVVEVTDLKGVDAPVRLTVGQTLERQDAASQALVSHADPQSVSDWQSGRMVYSGQSLAEVAQDLSRAFKVPVRVVGDSGDIRFVGVLTFDDEDAVLRRLGQFLQIVAYRVGDHYELKRR
jgi:transmembrane sensor